MWRFLISAAAELRNYGSPHVPDCGSPYLGRRRQPSDKEVILSTAEHLKLLEIMAWPIVTVFAILVVRDNPRRVFCDAVHVRICPIEELVSRDGR
jgi:hypothetical protein